MDSKDKKTKEFVPFRKQRFQTGFTLVELLVVVAIIGILSALILVSFTNYRNKGKDSRIETSLSQVRRVATIIFNENNSYQSVCVGNTLNGANSDLGKIKNDVMNNSGSNPSCYASAGAYCVQSSFATPGKSYCVDSIGYAGTSLTTCNANYVCQ